MMLTLVIVAAALTLALVPAYIADTKGRSFALWFVISLFITPLVAAVVVALLPPDEESLVRDGKLKRCPKCDELIKPAAAVCRFCGSPASRHSQRAALEKKMRERPVRG